MYDRILVPTDGSECADRAVDTALTFAEAYDTDVEVIYVLDLSVVPGSVRQEVADQFTEHGESILADASDRAEGAGFELSTEMVQAAESVHETIVSHAEERAVDLIVMGSHGRTGLTRLMTGSIAARTIRHSPIPVLTVKEQSIEADIETILLPTDGSAGATAAGEHAIELAENTGAALHVVHVVDVTMPAGEFGGGAVYEAFAQSGQEAVDEVVQRASQANITSTDASVISGRPARAIADYADEREIDVIVIGTHGRSGIDRYLLGSVAEAVVRTANAPVLTVNARAGAESSEEDVTPRS